MVKKGFTLIELLAVIIILAIIALIATPIILNVIEDARISAGKSEAQMIYSGINNYCASSMMEEQLNGKVDICADGVTTEEVSTMVNLGNAIVNKVSYSNGKVTELEVESNNHTFKLCGDGSFVKDEEECGVAPEEPEDPIAIEPNAPVLDTNMVPIKYDGTNWVYADTSESWYNYDNKEWANAVVLNSGVSKNVGDTITESDIALWYVWIPRYKYQLFNVGNESVTEQLINIEFESGTASTGTVSCTDAIATSGSSSETCTNATNGNWYTHPAFTFGEEELTGFWVGKFEVSGTTDNITIKPGVQSLVNMTIYEFFDAAQGINVTKDSHMIKNMEWGAIAYLKQSKYGLGATDMEDNSSEYYTGGGNTTTSYKSNINQSTTGNVYGVYDMSGGTYEYVMGSMVDNNGDFYSNEAGFASQIDDKYYDSYTYGESSTSQSRGKLGDATKETLTTFGNYQGGWYSDYAYFVNSNHSWFHRGGNNLDGDVAGIFNYSSHNGRGFTDHTTRVVILP